MGEEVAMAAVCFLFGWIPLKVIFNHKQRMAEIRARETGDAAALREDIDALRAEVKALRDTAMKFDLSFDHSLTEVQRRLDTLELRRMAGSTEPETQTQRLGGDR